MLATRLQRFELSVLLNTCQLISCSGTVAETILGPEVLISLHPPLNHKGDALWEDILRKTPMTLQLHYILSVARRRRAFHEATRAPSRILYRASTSRIDLGVTEDTMLSLTADPRRRRGHRRGSPHKLNISTWRRRSASGGLSLSGNLNGVSSAPIPACVEEMGHGIVGDIYFMFLNPSIKLALLSSAPSSSADAATSAITKEVFCLPSRLCLQFDALRH